MKVGVVADTHLRADSTRWLPQRALDVLDDVAVILHAGDIVEQDVLDRLARIAPVHAVLGNNDRALTGTLPECIELELAGVRVAMIHDSGARAGRERRLRRMFPDADVVVFGHSHIPWNAAGEDGQLLFNPGSPIQRRRQPEHTIGVLELDDGAVVAAGIVTVSDGAHHASR